MLLGGLLFIVQSKKDTITFYVGAVKICSLNISHPSEKFMDISWDSVACQCTSTRDLSFNKSYSTLVIMLPARLIIWQVGELGKQGCIMSAHKRVGGEGSGLLK